MHKGLSIYWYDVISYQLQSIILSRFLNLFFRYTFKLAQIALWLICLFNVFNINSVYIRTSFTFILKNALLSNKLFINGNKNEVKF